MINGHTPSRRRVLLGSALAAAGAFSVAAQTPSRPGARFAYVGCRTTKERNARGEGITVFRVDPVKGTWSQVQLVKELVNPSFLAFDKQQQFLYAVHGDLTEISAFRVEPKIGELTFLNRQSTEGRNPAHLRVDASNRFVIVANYATGTLAVLPRNADGSLEPVKQLEHLPGEPGSNKIEQTSSHPHEVAYDRAGRFLVVPDKGLDRIFSFRFDPEQGRLIPANPALVAVRPGAGPRHITFHPTAPFAFVAQELDSSVAAYRYGATTGALTPIQVIPSTPDTFTGANTAAEIEIEPSGRFVYVSNRGHDSIGTFSVDPSTGRLTPVGWTSSEGKGPRFFALDPSGTRLYAANENSDTIVPFSVDARSGRLTRADEVIRTGSPVCIVFATT